MIKMSPDNIEVECKYCGKIEMRAHHSENASCFNCRKKMDNERAIIYKKNNK